MKIRMLVDGHKAQEYSLEYAKNILKGQKRQGCIIVDDETRQLAKIEDLTEDSRVTVYPAVTGG